MWKTKNCLECELMRDTTHSFEKCFWSRLSFVKYFFKVSKFGENLHYLKNSASMTGEAKLFSIFLMSFFTSSSLSLLLLRERIIDAPMYIGIISNSVDIFRFVWSEVKCDSECFSDQDVSSFITLIVGCSQGFPLLYPFKKMPVFFGFVNFYSNFSEVLRA